MKIFLAFLLAVSAAAPQQEKVIGDDWYVVLINGAKAGYKHEVRKSTWEGGREILRTETLEEIKMSRAGTEIAVTGEGTYDETVDGQAVRFREQKKMSDQETLYAGEIKDKTMKLTIKTSGKETKKDLPWKSEYLFPAAIERLVRQKGFEPGTEYTYSLFSTDFGKAVTRSVKVLQKENVEVNGSERELVKCEATLDVMPLVTFEWMDAEGRVSKSQVDMMGLDMVVEKTDRAKALLTESGEVPEVFLSSLVRPKQKLADPRTLEKAVYRITVKGNGLKASLFTWDGQKVEKSEGSSVVVRVEPAQSMGSVRRPVTEPSLAEYLQENNFLQCGDEGIQAAAKEAIGDETDAWKAARKIEGWVYENIEHKGLGVGFATAKEVCENREGDCTEHAVLAAALARAAGIPSRVCFGIVAVTDDKGNVFGGHMWTEVWAGRWLPLDGAIKGDRFDASHVKFGESSLNGIGIAEDFVNCLLLLGKMEMDVLEYEAGGKKVKP